MRVKGQWTDLDRAVAKHGQPIDVLLTAQRDEQAAMGFLTKAIRRHGVSAQIPIDGREANAAAIRASNDAHGTAIIIRQMKSLHNLVAQDQRAVKRVTRPMLGCKSFDAAQQTLAGVELMHRLKTGPLGVEAGVEGLPPAEQFSVLAASPPRRQGPLHPHSKFVTKP